jgi:hypothetical protein
MKPNEMLPEYDFSIGTRGKFASRYAKGSNIVILAPDVSTVFPDSDSVNEALRSLMCVAACAKNPRRNQPKHYLHRPQWAKILPRRPRRQISARAYARLNTRDRCTRSVH